MTKKQLLAWLDDNLLAILAGVLFVFIPLWPKIPLFSPIEQYIVRVRFEDLLILFSALVWFVYWLRGKVAWKKPIIFGLIGYALVGLLSMISAVFIVKSVPLEPLHLGKSLLHYFRYLEYFSLFFIFFSAVQTRKHFKIMLFSLAATVMAVSVYGFGQKYYYWPVYSTMNREFSKGVRLYLTEHARVQSTFAGHYDLGAYLVIALPLLLALSFGVTNKKVKIALHIIHWLGLWLLVVSASRTSFIAYVFGISLVSLIYALQQASWWKKFRWFATRYLVLMLVVVQTFGMFGEDIYERFLQILKAHPELHDEYHAWNDQRKEYLDTYFLIPLGIKEVALPKAKKPKNAISTDEAQKIVLDSDTRPTPVDDGSKKPADVYVDVPDVVEVSTRSADGKITTTQVEKERTFSDNALKYGLSLAIRLDTLWPQAIEGFMTNPVLGKGYATLNKKDPYHFTEADSTDNNFLRTLGETGLLGFLTFYGSIAIALLYAVKARKSDDALLQALAIGYIGATAALLLNAIYIDVFAASKVAQVFWASTGLFFGYYYLVEKQQDIDEQIPQAAIKKGQDKTSSSSKTGQKVKTKTKKSSKKTTKKKKTTKSKK